MRLITKARLSLPVMIWLVLVLSLMLSAGCRNRVREENQILAAEVMAIHDRAMANMTRMHELRLMLEERETSGGATERTTSAIADLQAAHAAMMRWMREYRPPKTDRELDDAGAYLRAEQQKIEEIGGLIDTAIRQAEELAGR